MKSTRLRRTSFAITLLLGLIISSAAGCVMTTMPPKPAKPQLEVIHRPDGGVCFDRENAIKLGEYIIDLERGYHR